MTLSILTSYFGEALVLFVCELHKYSSRYWGKQIWLLMSIGVLTRFFVRMVILRRRCFLLLFSMDITEIPSKKAGWMVTAVLHCLFSLLVLSSLACWVPKSCFHTSCFVFNIQPVWTHDWEVIWPHETRWTLSWGGCATRHHEQEVRALFQPRVTCQTASNS